MQNLKDNIKLVATDIGGTLAHDDGTISRETIEIFRSLIAQNVHVALVTGYNMKMTEKYSSQISESLIRVIQNGAMIFEGAELIVTNYLDKDIASALIKYFESKNFSPILFMGVEDNGEAYFKRMNDEFVARDSFIEVSDFEDLLQKDPVEVSVWESTDKILACKEELESLYGENWNVTASIQKNRSWLEVLHPDAQKDVALLAIMERKGIKADEVIYFGDNLNDISCLKLVKYPVVVSNALKDVKELAWKVALSNNNDGVADILKQIFIL